MSYLEFPYFHGDVYQQAPPKKCLRKCSRNDAEYRDVDCSSASSEGHPVSGTEVSRSLPVSRSA